MPANTTKNRFTPIRGEFAPQISLPWKTRQKLWVGAAYFAFCPSGLPDKLDIVVEKF